jgi:hypothetical protein
MPVDVIPQLKAKKGAFSWTLMRHEGSPIQQHKCSVHAGGMKLHRFELAKLPPDLPSIRELWGSGMYSAIWFDKDGKSKGPSPTFTIDDPAHPPKPLYANAPAPAVVPEPEPPPSPPPVPDEPAVIRTAREMAALSGGSIPLPMVTLLLQDAEDRRRRDRDEYEQRERRAREDHAERMMRIKADAEAAVRIEEARSRSNVDHLMKLQEAMATHAPSGQLSQAVLDRLDSIEEQLDDRDDDTGPREKSALEQIAEAAKPHVPALLEALAALVSKGQARPG